MRIPKTSRRQFLIGTALASVAAASLAAPILKEKRARKVTGYYDGPIFQVLTTDRLRPRFSTIRLESPSGYRVTYSIGLTITQEMIPDMTREDSGPVLYDSSVRAMQRLHEVHDPDRWMSGPRPEPYLSPTRRHAGVLWPDYGGHWA